MQIFVLSPSSEALLPQHPAGQGDTEHLPVPTDQALTARTGEDERMDGSTAQLSNSIETDAADEEDRVSDILGARAPLTSSCTSGSQVTGGSRIQTQGSRAARSTGSTNESNNKRQG